jgi:hypothetical protein
MSLSVKVIKEPYGHSWIKTSKYHRDCENCKQRIRFIIDSCSNLYKTWHCIDTNSGCIMTCEEKRKLDRMNDALG